MPHYRTILHCDLNGFYASVEALAHPEIGSRPMAVAGDPKSRHGIILAKNEAAKKFGVATGEAIWQAKRKCPDLVLLEPHHEKYAKYSRLVNEVYAGFTDRVEPFGIDESWLDVSGSLKLFGSGREIADKLRDTIRRKFGLTISVGVSYNKVFAKLASDYKKPDATTVFGRAEYGSVVRKMPASSMLFVGGRTAAALSNLGILTIGDLADFPRNTLERKFGKFGKTLSEYARGEDSSEVDFYGHEDAAKSIGNSITFGRDLLGRADVEAGLSKVADKLVARMFRAGVEGGQLGVSIKGADFTMLYRQRKMPRPTGLRSDIVAFSLKMVEDNWDIENEPIRLLGISCSDLRFADSERQAELFFDAETISERKRKAAEKAFFMLRDKFGSSAISFGDTFKSGL